MKTFRKGSECRFIGRCGLIPWTIDQRQEVEVAYLLDKVYWGQGLATESAQGIVHYAFEYLKLPRLICLIDPENESSRRVAQKIGMRLERDDFVDEHGLSHVYAMECP